MSVTFGRLLEDDEQRDYGKRRNHQHSLSFPERGDHSWQFEKKGQKVEVAVEGHLTVNDEELAIRAAMDGVGVLYTALGYAATEIKAGRLVPLLEDWRTGSAAFFLYYPSRRQVPLPLQAFIEFLRKNLRAHPGEKT